MSCRAALLLSSITALAGAALSVPVAALGATAAARSGHGAARPASIAAATLPPTITKAFGAASVLQGGSTSLTFNVSNPNASGLTGVAFQDTLPAGLVVATPAAVTSDCGGTTTAADGAGSLSLAGGTLAANGACTITLNVTAVAAGVQNNTTAPVSATESGAGAPSNTASVTVIGAPSIAKAFGAASISLNGSTTLTFTITNPNATVALTGVGFGDTLPSGLNIANPNGLTGSCGAGTITTGSVSGFSVANLAGGTIAAGGSCTFSVNVIGTSGGHKVNTTGTVFSSNAGSGNQATASIDVTAPDPTITKTHVGTLSPGQTGGQFTLTVANAGFGPTVGTVTVTDTLPNIPNTLVPTSLSGTGWTCTLATLTCTRSDALPGGSSYPPITLTVNVPLNIQPSFTNTATVSGGGDVNPNNNTAADAVVAALPPTIGKAFGAASIAVGTTTTLGFTLANPNPATALSGIAFSDTLPAGLIVATPNGLAGACGGGTITAAAGSNAISLSGATLAANASCSFSVAVKATATGNQVNVTGPVSSTEGGSGGTATASVLVALPPAEPAPMLRAGPLWLLIGLLLAVGGALLARRTAR